MTDTTDLGDVYAVGQRRRRGGMFPSSGGGGGGGGEGGDQPQETSDGENGGDLGPMDPCADPATALEWNADAAAAAAAAEFDDWGRSPEKRV